MGLSEDDKRRIEDEERHRQEVRRKLEQEAKQKAKLPQGCQIGCLVLVLLMGLGGLIKSCEGDEASPGSPAAPVSGGAPPDEKAVFLRYLPISFRLMSANDECGGIFQQLAVSTDDGEIRRLKVKFDALAGRMKSDIEKIRLLHPPKKEPWNLILESYSELEAYLDLTSRALEQRLAYSEAAAEPLLRQALEHQNRSRELSKEATEWLRNKGTQ